MKQKRRTTRSGQAGQAPQAGPAARRGRLDQLELPGIDRPWRLDETTRRRGLRGVAEARQIIRETREQRPSSPGDHRRAA